MARASLQPSPTPPAQASNPHEWQALRGELVALLDQVEGRYVKTPPREEEGLGGIAERMRDLREQVGGSEPESRRQAALRSVKRAVDRFNGRDEHAQDAVEASTREALEAAIGEIRARQHSREDDDLIVPPRPANESGQREFQQDLSPRFDDLAHSVSTISGRLERLEVELKAQRHNQGAIKEIADQVSQVSQVVELLAGAVGETGHVKRLETQIAGLAKLITEGQRLDSTTLSRRIDDVSTTVERLADLQSQQVNRERNMPDLVRRLDSVSASVEKLANLQAQHVAREKDLPGIGAQLGQVNQSIAAVSSSVSTVSNSVSTLAQRQAESIGREMQIPIIGQQIGAVSESVERLIDLQTMHVRSIKDVPAQQEAIRAHLGAIEKSVRSVYDRIDAVEQDTALQPADVEKLTSEMARFTQALEAATPPQALLELADALSGRVSGIESHDAGISGLKDDIAALRQAVIDAVEPRMAALETRIEALDGDRVAIAEVAPRMAAIQSQLEALNERVAERDPEPSVGQIEAQVRHLVARMDQTGEQLSGLARLYASAGEREPTDYEALAELVAARTSEAVASWGPGGSPGVTAQDMSDLEARMGRLIKAVAADSPAGAFSDVAEGIRKVDERLGRLELALGRLAEESDTSAAPGQTDIHVEPVLDTPIPTILRRNDAMPASPAEDRPLVDEAFAHGGPIRVMLETRIPSRREHVPLDDDPIDLSGMPAISPQMVGGPLRAPAPPPISPQFVGASFDFDAPPPRPQSSLQAHEQDYGFANTPGQEPAPAGSEPVSASRSSFIEAARRAAQRQQSVPPESSAGSSLIGRALARLQTAGKTQPDAEEGANRTEKPRRGRGKAEAAPAVLAPEAESREEPAVSADAVSEAATVIAGTEQLISDASSNESFLLRHRQPILLAASVVALCFLTLNLVNQRLAESPVEPAAGVAVASAEPASEMSAAPADLSAPISLATAASTWAPAIVKPSAIAPRVIPMTDSLATGSVDPVVSRFTPSPKTQGMPQSFVPQANAPAPAAIESPVKVELPPESLGPLELRQAAADGDARAQFEVGAIYTEGRAVTKDLKAAATWYERAAAQGFAPAQYRLANLYENGLGVEKNLEQARLWYQRAAEAGNRMSMHNLAALYAGGQLGKQEFASAAEWFEKAAAEGLTDSQFNLGMLYARGLGVTQDMESSYRWFAIAAKSGDTDAAKARDDIAKSLDAETVTRLGTEIDAWRPVQINLAANFAPIGTWSAKFDPGEQIRTRDVVLGVQTLLGRLGYDVGTPDGVAGPKTSEAIRAFERATGMSESGAINPRLLAVLSSQPV